MNNMTVKALIKMTLLNKKKCKQRTKEEWKRKKKRNGHVKDREEACPTILLPRSFVLRDIVLSRYKIVSSPRPRGPLSYINVGTKRSRVVRYACAYQEIILQSSNLLHLNRGVETEYIIIVYISGQGWRVYSSKVIGRLLSFHEGERGGGGRSSFLGTMAWEAKERVTCKYAD